MLEVVDFVATTPRWDDSEKREMRQSATVAEQKSEDGTGIRHLYGDMGMSPHQTKYIGL